MTGADRVEITDYEAIEWSRRVYKLGRKALRSRALARALVPSASRSHASTREYELFFPVFNHPFELFALAAVPDWRRSLQGARSCLVSEIWVQELPEYLIELLADFDHLFVAVQHPAPEVARIVGRALHLPAPGGRRAAASRRILGRRVRSIDVCNIGRRSAVTHAALLEPGDGSGASSTSTTRSGRAARVESSSPSRVGNAAEHRLFLADVLRRSRYYLAYRSRVNEPEQTEGREEISGRFYEGAAAGAVLLGEPPRSDGVRPASSTGPTRWSGFRSTRRTWASSWPALDRDPERLERIRRTNAQQAALRHDWLYRLETVFAAVGLPPTEAMTARSKRLAELARLALEGGDARGDQARSARPS